MRKSDSSDGTCFRSGNRVFCLKRKWFYQTREADHGPFPDRQTAVVDLQRYVDDMHFFDGIQDGGQKSAAKPSQQDDVDFANFSLVDKD